MGKVRNWYSCAVYDNPPMLNIRFEAGAVGAGVASAPRRLQAQQNDAAPCGGFGE
jgi:hypothetical protein